MLCGIVSSHQAYSASIHTVGLSSPRCSIHREQPSCLIQTTSTVGLSSSCYTFLVASLLQSAFTSLACHHPAVQPIVSSHPASTASIYIVGLLSSCCSTHREQPSSLFSQHSLRLLVTIQLHECRSQPSASTSVNVSCVSLHPHALSWSAKSLGSSSITSSPISSSSISSSSISSSPIRSSSVSSSPINHAESWVQIQPRQRREPKGESARWRYRAHKEKEENRPQPDYLDDSTDPFQHRSVWITWRDSRPCQTPSDLGNNIFALAHRLAKSPT